MKLGLGGFPRNKIIHHQPNFTMDFDMDTYEYRLALLQLAQSIIQDRVISERERLVMDWEIRKERGPITEFPTLPSVDHNEVIQIAQELETYATNRKTN